MPRAGRHAQVHWRVVAAGSEALELNPFDEAVFVLCNRQRDKIQISELIEPLIERCRHHLQSSAVIHMDETTLQVNTEPDRKASSPSYMWAHASAKLYRLIETARANGIEPYSYMVEVLTKLPHRLVPDTVSGAGAHEPTLFCGSFSSGVSDKYRAGLETSLARPTMECSLAMPISDGSVGARSIWFVIVSMCRLSIHFSIFCA
ncbi:MAG: transposase [Marinobacter sp.]|nr:transposase [Marinobacter sp.]MBQ0813322.1 transposase [Marinobacter sp.]